MVFRGSKNFRLLFRLVLFWKREFFVRDCLTHVGVFILLFSFFSHTKFQLRDDSDGEEKFRLVLPRLEMLAVLHFFWHPPHLVIFHVFLSFSSNDRHFRSLFLTDVLTRVTLINLSIFFFRQGKCCRLASGEGVGVNFGFFPFAF